MPDMFLSHTTYMQLALEQAHQAYQLQEVPVGAIVVSDSGKIVGRGYNRTIIDCDPSGHAEIIALRMAATQLCNYRLSTCRLYVTLEPCVMCLGAILNARIAHLLYGASDAKIGACGGLLSVHANRTINHHTRVSTGIMARECAALLKQFFKEKR